jgi:hypothetical protein
MNDTRVTESEGEGEKEILIPVFMKGARGSYCGYVIFLISRNPDMFERGERKEIALSPSTTATPTLRPLPRLLVALVPFHQ